VRAHDWHPSCAIDCADGIKLSHGHAPLSEIRVFIAETAFGLRLFQWIQKKRARRRFSRRSPSDGYWSSLHDRRRSPLAAFL